MSMDKMACLTQWGCLGKIEADFHIIHGVRTRIQNTIRCVKELPLDVEDVLCAGFCAGCPDAQPKRPWRARD